MTLNGKIVWDNLKNQLGNHLEKQIRWAFTDLKPEYAHNNLFSQNISTHHALDKIRTYFQQVRNIELGFLSATGVLLMLRLKK